MMQGVRQHVCAAGGSPAKEQKAGSRAIACAAVDSGKEHIAIEQ